MAFLVCYSWAPPTDHAEMKAIYLDQSFYELVFDSCRGVDSQSSILSEIAMLKYKSPALVVDGERLVLLSGELKCFAELAVGHPQISEFAAVCLKAHSNGCALTISGDMYPELR